MKLFTIILALMLSGCATWPFQKEADLIVQQNYVVRTAPDSLKTLPPLPATLPNPKTASGAAVARWISDTEQYAADLESMVQTLVNFYEKPVTVTEVGDMKPITPRATATPTPSRVIQPQTAASASK